MLDDATAYARIRRISAIRRQSDSFVGPHLASFKSQRGNEIHLASIEMLLQLPFGSQLMMRALFVAVIAPREAE